jgi:hypothetical protein
VVPDRVRYLEEVQDLYLALRGSGLCLSPLDVDLVGGWWADGVPLPLALDAVREAAARHRGSGRAAARRPFPLRLAAALVEDRFGAYVRRSGTVARPDAGPPAGDATPPAPGSGAPAPGSGAPAPGRLDRVAARLEGRAAAAGPTAAAAYRAAARALAVAAAAGEPLDRALAAADDTQALAYLRALPRAEQRRVAGAAIRDAGPRGRVPRGAHRATLRVHLGDAARRHGGLVRPSDPT